jgi:hypothetical protein
VRAWRSSLGIVAAALFVAGPAFAADRIVERGIVQSVSATAVVLRALDGTDVTIALGPDTRYRLNGLPVRRERIGAGLVAEAVVSSGGTALVLRAFGRAPPVIRNGILLRVGEHAVVLRVRGGARVRIPLSDRTAVRRAGLPVSPSALQRGMRVRVRLAVDGSARVVTVLGR